MKIFTSALFALLAWAFAAAATERSYVWNSAHLEHPDLVDVALVLAVDVSSSVSAAERRFQREAYAAALTDERVISRALSGYAGQIAVGYMEWSGARFQRVIVPVRTLSSAEDIRDFARQILSTPDHVADPMYASTTAIGSALREAEAALAAFHAPARSYVIDISGDGVQNSGESIVNVRQQLVGMGLTINALPIEVEETDHGYRSESFADIRAFFEDCVIGGAGSFSVSAKGFSDVVATLRIKLMMELASLDELPAGARTQISQAWSYGPRTAEVIPAMALSLEPSGAKPRKTVSCEAPGRIPH